MARISQIKGVDRVIMKLQQELQKKLDSPNKVSGRSAITGYTAAYAVPVHERPGKPDPETKRGPKYLEGPARENAKAIGITVRTAVQKGVSLEKSMVLGLLLLQRESQKVVPVDTGNLRGSAFTKFEN